MAQSEFSKLRGMKLESEKELKELEYRADNHIITIRSLVDPLFSFEEIEIERAEQAMTSLKVIITKAREHRKKIKDIDSRIGNG